MTSIYFYVLVLLFLIFHHNFYRIMLIIFLKVMSHVTTFPGMSFQIMIMTSIFSIYHTQIFNLVQIVFVLLVSIFVNIPFLYSVFNDIFYVNNITNIFGSNLYITFLLNRDSKFLYCNCTVKQSHCFNKKISSKYTRFLSHRKITTFFL